MRSEPSSHVSGFGKRGRVEIKTGPGSAPVAPEPKSASSIPAAELAKWAGGGVAAVVLIGALVGGSGGGGGFLAGLLGGLAAKQMAQSPTRPAGDAANSAQRTSAHATTVQRGGFGTTGAGSGSSSFSGGS
jgi:hypothetical protein